VECIHRRLGYGSKKNQGRGGARHGDVREKNLKRVTCRRASDKRKPAEEDWRGRSSGDKGGLS